MTPRQDADGNVNGEVPPEAALQADEETRHAPDAASVQHPSENVDIAVPGEQSSRESPGVSRQGDTSLDTRPHQGHSLNDADQPVQVRLFTLAILRLQGLTFPMFSSHLLNP